MTGNVQTPAIYIVNHASTLDILTILALGHSTSSFCCKMGDAIFSVLFPIGRLTGQIFIKRGNREKAIQTLQKNYEKVQQHHRSILIAPEGTRKHVMPIGPFKKGAFQDGTRLKLPHSPHLLSGNYRIKHEGGSLFTKTGSITAHVFSPISTDSWTESTLEKNIEDIRNKYLQWSSNL